MLMCAQIPCGFWLEAAVPVASDGRKLRGTSRVPRDRKTEAWAVMPVASDGRKLRHQPRAERSDDTVLERWMQKLSWHLWSEAQ